MNIYECLDQPDGENLRELLCQSSDDEQRLVCTLRLPKGKRPSRTREDVKVNDARRGLIRLVTLEMRFSDHQHGWPFLFVS